MTLLISAYLFTIGACFGSFAGAMAWRLEKRRDIVRERSECEHCHRQLAVKDLLPVVSWLWLKGACRYCKKPIGYSTLLLEVGLGGLFVLSYQLWPFPLVSLIDWTYLAGWFVAYVCLAILFVYDLRHYLLPDRVMWPLIAIGAVLFGLMAVAREWTAIQAITELALSLLPVTGLYGVLYAASGGKWVGFGDVKLGVFIGLALGWQGALLTLLLANLVGTAYILPSMASGALKKTDRVPFGPFLIVGTIVSVLFSDGIIRWYLGLLGV